MIKYGIEIGMGTEALIQLGSLETSQHPFVSEVRTVLSSLDEKIIKLTKGDEELNKRVKMACTPIEWKNKRNGLGYASSSVNHNREKEVVAAALIARAFRKNDMKAEPLIIPIDEFYTFYPGCSSLVGKTWAFNNEATEMNKPGYALILTDFTSSKVFTQQALEQAPSQRNAGLDYITEDKDFSSKFSTFEAKQIPLIMEKEKGNLDNVINKLAKTPENINDARMLLATCLLLRDKQCWQDLWYEGKEEGTPLYIVAPVSFHEAMNRLNRCWGHGGLDYIHRSTLRNNDEPLFDEYDFEKEIRTEKGLSLNQFRGRVSKFF